MQPRRSNSQNIPELQSLRSLRSRGLVPEALRDEVVSAPPEAAPAAAVGVKREPSERVRRLWQTAQASRRRRGGRVAGQSGGHIAGPRVCLAVRRAYKRGAAC